MPPKVVATPAACKPPTLAQRLDAAMQVANGAQAELLLRAYLVALEAEVLAAEAIGLND
jgi:hypothetical protein